ncbi:MAG: hypothetical protein C5B59_00005 [Bacteroidetes bacterium]|nr:MAG: hypothetical protein C5B59_00005 [Bacteroidota bacterium]
MSEKNTHPDDYINLGGLKRIAYQLLDLFFTSVNYLLSIFAKSKLLLLTGLISGMIVGYSYFRTKVPTYEVSMIVQSTELNNQTLANIIDQLGTLAQAGSQQRLADELNITPNQASRISLISTRRFDGEPLDKDTSRVHQPFEIIARITDKDITDKLQSAIIAYLNENSYLTKVQDNRTRMNQEKIAFIDNELAKLDTLKTEYNRFLTTARISATVYYNALNPAEIYDQSGKLMKEKENVMRSLNVENTPVLMINGFNSTSEPQTSSLSRALLLGALVGLAICYLLGLFVDLNRIISGKRSSKKA